MNKYRSLFLSFLFLSGLIPLSAQEAGQIVLDAVAADVGGVRITVADVMENVREEINNRRLSGAEASAAAKTLFLPALSNLVDRQLILLKYEKIGRKLPSWYLNQRVEKIIEENFNGDRSRLVEMLSSRGISYAKWRKKIENDTLIMTMKQQFVNQKVVVKPEEVRSEYEKNYKTKKLPGPVRVSMIQLRTEGRTGEENAAEAAKLVAKLRAGGDFAAAASEFSVEPHAGNGGDWGYVDPGYEFRSEIADAIAKLKTGEVSDPVVIGDNLVYILKKTDERTDLTIPYDFISHDIEKELKTRYADARYRAWTESLAKEFTVRIYPLK